MADIEEITKEQERTIFEAARLGMEDFSSLSLNQFSCMVERAISDHPEKVHNIYNALSDSLANMRRLFLEEVSQQVHHEVVRAPKKEELQKITIADCVVFTKRSMVMYDSDRLSLSHAEVIESYRNEGYSEERIESIIASHKEQERSVEAFKRMFQGKGIEPRIFVLDLLPEEEIRDLVAKFPVVVGLGGDDHIKAVSQYVPEGKFFIPVNSDSNSSVGAITYFDRRTLDALFERLEKGEFLLEEWARLNVSVTEFHDGELITKNFPPVLSEVSIADASTLYTFRGVASLQSGEKWSIKGSGILITTGVGSTGWYSSTARFIYPFGRQYPRTEKSAEFVVREPYGEVPDLESVSGAFSSDEILTVTTSSKHAPEVAGDSLWRYPLSPGSVVSIRVGGSSLSVVSNSDLIAS